MPIHQQGGRIQNVCVRQQNVCVAALEKVLCYRCSSVVWYALALMLHLIHVHTLCSVVYESRGESVGTVRRLAECWMFYSLLCVHTQRFSYLSSLRPLFFTLSLKNMYVHTVVGNRFGLQEMHTQGCCAVSFSAVSFNAIHGLPSVSVSRAL